MRLILVRHGRTNSNLTLRLDTAYPGADLDSSGLEQAAALVERVSRYPIDAIYTSDLVRTQQTARPVAERRGLKSRALPGLREISAGDDEMLVYRPGTPNRYMETMIAWGAGHPEVRVPGGENLPEFLDRFDAAIATICNAGHEVAMVVSHGAALRVWAFSRVDGFAPTMGQAHLDNTGFIVVDGSPQSGWTLVHSEGVTRIDLAPAES